MQSKRASYLRLLNIKHKVSCHYFIDREGEVVQMVKDNKVAWHAGKSKWKSFINLNESSIGIELVNKGHRFGYEKFPKKQIKQLVKLCSILKKKYSISKSNILGHSDIAPLRKRDPGENFPWKKFYKQNLINISLKKKDKLQYLTNLEIRHLFFKNIFKIGYRYFLKNKASKRDKLIVQAFQRKFLQKSVTGKIDQKTLKISHYLANVHKN